MTFNVQIPVAYYVRLQVKANNEIEAKQLALEAIKHDVETSGHQVEGFDLMEAIDLDGILVAQDGKPFPLS